MALGAYMAVVQELLILLTELISMVLEAEVQYVLYGEQVALSLQQTPLTFED